MSSPRRVLLTGGRAPATLDLARKLHRAGHRVFVAESLRFPLTIGSRAVRRSFHIAPPRQKEEQFARDLEEILSREKIDLLIPTCEEVFYVARIRERLESCCPVLCDSSEKLGRVHSKWRFVKLAGELGLSVPRTVLLSSREELAEEVRRPVPLVLKPEYSRFGAAVRIRRDPRAAIPLPEPSRGRRWVAQELLVGRQLCTYSVAHEGSLLAHATYPTTYTAGPGASVYFEPCEHPTIRDWVSRFVGGIAWTGQIAFDFIETERGVFALECNPRLTSGIHLFDDAGAICEALLGRPRPTVRPATRKTMVATAMVLYALPAVRSRRELGEWLRAFSSAGDVVFRGWDPFVQVSQLLCLLEIRITAWRRGTDLLAASTCDIEWNGEADNPKARRRNP